MSKEPIPLCLTVSERNGRVFSLVFEKEEITIGRAQEMDVRFSSSIYTMISRRHGRFTRDEEGQIIYEDLGSTQGSYLGRKKISEPVAIGREDAVTIGLDGPAVSITWPIERVTGKEGTHIRFYSRKNPHFPLVFSEGFLGKFNSYKRIGTGGFGEVWRAVPANGDKPVAVKLLHPLLLDPEYIGTQDRESILRRFVREAHVMQGLSESKAPGIVTVHSWGDDPHRDYVYIIMELVDGYSLDKIITKNEVLDERFVSRVMLDVCKALDAAHNFEFLDVTGGACHGVIHRDVKPHNILVNTKTGQSWLVDFGIAGIVTGGERLTMSSMTIGTRQFLPPEALESAIYGPKTDLWGVAVTLYLCLAGGRFPFRGDNEIELLETMKRNAAIPIHAWRSGLHPELAEALRKGLDPDPDSRLQTAREWADVFESVIKEATSSSGKIQPEADMPTES